MEKRILVGSACAILLSLLGACDDGTGGGGGGGDGGGGGGGAGGDGPVLEKGAWAVAFTDGPGCGPGAENTAVGMVSASSADQLLSDGEDQATVSCQVAAAGSGFGVAATATQNGRALTFAIDNLPTTATPDDPALGTVSYATPNTGNTFTSAQCAFYFLDETLQGVEPGKVWLTFTCPQIAASVDNVCSIDVSYAAFDGCRTQLD